MAKVNVAQFATELKLSVDKLVEQLKAAGVKKALTKATALTEGDKTKLLEYLRKAHGAKDGKSRITLTRRQTSEIRKSDGSGKARTIQVEVRKKRVLVKRDADAEKEKKTVAPVAAPAMTAKQKAQRVEEARKQAELISRQAAEVAAKKVKRDRKTAAKTDEPVKPETAEKELTGKDQKPAQKAPETVAKKVATEGTLR